jgi:thiol:disulfide interchange protein
VYESTVAKKLCVALALCLCIVVPLSARHKTKAPPPKPSGNTASGFDPARDPAKDLQDAIAEATRTKKRILMEICGDWSIYCNLMETTFAKHSNLQRVRDMYYVTVKVEYSKDHPNAAFLSQYPPVPDYPHFFVLDSKGTLLLSQPTRKFEQGKKYNARKIEDFLKKDSHPPVHLFNVVK